MKLLYFDPRGQQQLLMLPHVEVTFIMHFIIYYMDNTLNEFLINFKCFNNMLQLFQIRLHIFAKGGKKRVLMWFGAPAICKPCAKPNHANRCHGWPNWHVCKVYPWTIWSTLFMPPHRRCRRHYVSGLSVRPSGCLSGFPSGSPSGFFC